MEISVSLLSIKSEEIESKLKIIDDLNFEYIHLDIADGIFVPNKSWDFDFIGPLVKNIKTPLDVHLMVSDVKDSIDKYATLNPEYITFHLEAVDNAIEMIEYIKSKNIKVGLALSPDTSVSGLYQYLELIDLVLLMSVKTGFGGQGFISSALDKLADLKTLSKQYNFKLELDGGIKDYNIDDCLKANILVVGSYITNATDYKDQKEILYNLIK